MTKAVTPEHLWQADLALQIYAIRGVRFRWRDREWALDAAPVGAYTHACGAVVIPVGLLP